MRQTQLFSSFQNCFFQIKRPVQVSLAALMVCSGGMIPVLAQTSPSSLPAASSSNQTVLYVNPASGTDSASAGRAEMTPYRTITYAIQQAKPGNIIQLAPGNYTAESGETFPLLLTPGINLRGDVTTNGQSVVITGSGSNRSSTFGTQNITMRAAEDTTISGITLTNPNTRGTALWIESSNPVVRKNTFQNSLREGVFVTGTGSPKIEENIFFKNSANGMSVVRAARGEIRFNLFQNTGYGISFGDTAAPLVDNNRFTENRAGITVSESARPVLRNNLFENNIQDGVAIAAFSLAQPDLGTAESTGNNIFRNNGGYDINNSARNNPILAVGNQLDPKRIIGLVSTRPPGDFSDIPTDYWAQNYIRALAIKNIISGFPDGTFRPNEPVTRAQFATIVAKAFASEQRSPAITFKDVQRGFWGYDAIQTAAKSGFIAGYPGDIFKPNQQIPRVQVLVSLASGLKLADGTASVLSLYQDASQIPAYATVKVAAATNQNIVVNYPTTGLLNPNRDATRAEVAAFVYQALVNAGKAEPISSPYAVVPNPNANFSSGPTSNPAPSPNLNPSVSPNLSPSSSLSPSPNPTFKQGF